MAESLPLKEKKVYPFTLKLQAHLTDHWLLIPLPYFPVSGCSKLTTSLVNISLNFQTLILEFANIFC